MSKKMTTTIAKALAEKVRAELVARNKSTSDGIKSKIQKSKDYKDLLKVNSQIHELEKKRSELKDTIQENHSNKIADVSISLYSSSDPSIYIREKASASVDGIKDLILIEDYLSDDTKTLEEFINLIIEKLTN